MPPAQSIWAHGRPGGAKEPPGGVPIRRGERRGPSGAWYLRPGSLAERGPRGALVGRARARRCPQRSRFGPMGALAGPKSLRGVFGSVVGRAEAAQGPGPFALALWRSEAPGAPLNGALGRADAPDAVDLGPWAPRGGQSASGGCSDPSWGAPRPLRGLDPSPWLSCGARPPGRPCRAR